MKKERVKEVRGGGEGKQGGTNYLILVYPWIKTNRTAIEDTDDVADHSGEEEEKDGGRQGRSRESHMLARGSGLPCVCCVRHVQQGPFR